MRTRSSRRAACAALCLSAACRVAAAPPGAVASPFWGCASLDRGVALTFDDGPSAFTDTLLDELRDARATAAFFVLAGAAQARPDTVRRALAEGHTVGLHTWSHANLTALHAANDTNALRHEIDDAIEALERITGQRPRYFRPPFGALSAGVRDYLHARGFTIALWTAGCFDWALHDAGKEIPIYLDSMADAGGVLCLHDIHASTVAETPALIAALRSGKEGGWVNPQGREVISLDRCTGAAVKPEERGGPWADTSQGRDDATA